MINLEDFFSLSLYEQSLVAIALLLDAEKAVEYIEENSDTNSKHLEQYVQHFMLADIEVRNSIMASVLRRSFELESKK